MIFKQSHLIQSSLTPEQVMEKIRGMIGPKGDSFPHEVTVDGMKFTMSPRTYEGSEETEGQENILSGEVQSHMRGSSIYVTMTVAKPVLIILTVLSIISLMMILAVISVKELQKLIVILSFIAPSLIAIIVSLLVREILKRDFKSLIDYLRSI